MKKNSLIKCKKAEIKKIIVLFLLLSSILGIIFYSIFKGDTGYVHGYYRDDGVHVKGYYRSKANAYKYDNYSYDGGEMYNESYYNPTIDYPLDWYTPSWETDKTYRYGKLFYDNRHKRK